MILDELLQIDAARARRHASTPACCSRRRSRPGRRSRSASASTIEVAGRVTGRPWTGPEPLLRRREGRGAASARSPAPTPGSPASAASSPRRAPARRVRRVRRQARRVEGQPARRLDREGRLERGSSSATCPTTRCTTRATPRSAARRARSPATAAKAAGPAPTRPSAACTSTDLTLRMDPLSSSSASASASSSA